MTGQIPVSVRGIAAGGAGVADLPDGRVVFVPRTAPGDRVRVRIEKSKPRWAVASLQEILEAGPDRRAALCSLYETCGGCQLQHIPYARQLEWKARIVEEALARIGGVRLPDHVQVVGSPRETDYRNRITYTLRRLAGGRVVAGFHALHRPSHVIDVHGECVLPRPVLADTWRALRAGWGEGAILLPTGGRLRLTLREGGMGVALVVEGGASGWSAAPLARAVPSLAAIWHAAGDTDEQPRLVVGSDEADSIAFVQVNPEAAARLAEHVLGLPGPAARAVDAYSGAGEYAKALALAGWEVTAIEVDPAACAAARKGAPPSCLVLQGRAEDLLEDTLPADLLVVNPPRAGLDSEVVRTIAAHRPPRVIYVSCDPATLARDVAALSSGYAVASVRCFDLFPQTAHVETVLVLERKAS